MQAQLRRAALARPGPNRTVRARSRRRALRSRHGLGMRETSHGLRCVPRVATARSDARRRPRNIYAAGDELKLALDFIHSVNPVSDAEKDFAGESMGLLDRWQQLAQVLMLANEFMFVD